MSCRFSESLRTGSKHVWHILFLCVQWKTPDDGQRNCPKHVEFYSKNKFEKLVNLVGFIIRMNVVFYALPPNSERALLFESFPWFTLCHCGKRNAWRRWVWWNDTDTGKLKCFQKNLSHYHSVQHRSNTNWLQIEAGPRRWGAGRLPAWATARGLKVTPSWNIVKDSVRTAQ